MSLILKQNSILMNEEISKYYSNQDFNNFIQFKNINQTPKKIENCKNFSQEEIQKIEEIYKNKLNITDKNKIEQLKNNSIVIFSIKKYLDDELEKKNENSHEFDEKKEK